MEILGIAAVAVITVLCYLIGKTLKAWDLFDDRKIPPVMGIAGAALGVAAFFIAPDLVKAPDILTAAGIGAVSGLAATGLDQVVKQAQKEE